MSAEKNSKEQRKERMQARKCWLPAAIAGHEKRNDAQDALMRPRSKAQMPVSLNSIRLRPGTFGSIGNGVSAAFWFAVIRTGFGNRCVPETNLPPRRSS
jgi:hypothetical protein